METLDHSLTFQKRLIEVVRGVPASDDMENKIIHTIEKVLEETRQKPSEKEKPTKEEIAAAWSAIRQSNPFKDIHDPVVWQRSLRKDRDLPYRQ